MNRSRGLAAITAIISAFTLVACGSGDPQPQITATPTQTPTEAETPTVDPTEAAEAAAIEAVERYADTVMAAGLSGDWSEETLALGMRGDALANQVDFGPMFPPGSYEGEIVVSDIQILELTLDPLAAQVQLCSDTTGWLTQGQPGRANMVLARVAEEDGTAFVTEYTGQGTPCE